MYTRLLCTIAAAAALTLARAALAQTSAAAPDAQFAYEVAKERKGIYLYWQYLAQPGIVEECERNLRMLDNVIRYLTTKVDENVNVSARPSEIDDTSYDKAAQTAADEEDLFLSRGTEDVSTDDDEDEFGEDFSEEPGSGPDLGEKE